MHPSSFGKMARFVDLYLANYSQDALAVMDVGSRVIGGGISYRSLFEQNEQWTYVGLDMQEGQNVDICLSDPYDWKEIETNSQDVVVSGQAFEHIRFFWITFHEICRVLKEGGLACIIAPSAGKEHRFPVDCWRYYRDGFSALCEYVGFEQVEVFTDWGMDWSDSFLVMQKPRLSPEERARFMRKNFAQQLALTGDLGRIHDFRIFEFSPGRHESVIAAQTNRDAAFCAYKEESVRRCGADFLLGLGAEEIKRGLLADALETFRKGISLYPKQKDFYLLCGRLQRDTGDISGAIDTFKSGVDLDPSDFGLQASLAHLYYRVFRGHSQIRKDDVISAHERALAIKSDDRLLDRLTILRSE